ncbi:hypothetical protein RPHASCH2410_CH13305 [Rhizobium phaseoli Ch24-10]|nr:hypothetical protein RPHASCH2410_CH13305 [Rhizobium phaseoli Ch24-10]
MDVKSSQVIGNAASHYTAWQLSRRGWNVMPTSTNAKGSDLFCANDAETIFSVSKAKALRNAIPWGLAQVLPTYGPIGGSSRSGQRRTLRPVSS